MCYADYCDEIPERYWQFERTARKAYRCNDCGRQIQAGEKYYAALFDMGHDSYESLKHCTHCREAARWLHVVCSGWLWGGILDDLEEHIEELGVFTDDMDEEPQYPTLQKLVDAGRADWGYVIHADDPGGPIVGLIPLNEVARMVDDALAVLPEKAFA